MTAVLDDRSPAALADFTRVWLAEHLPTGWMDAVDGDDADALAGLRAGLDYDEWCIHLGEAGLATPTWPAEYGAGLSLSPGEAKHVNDVLGHYKIPRPYNIIGIGMGGPTVIAWGSEELKQQFLRGIATNEEIWCQLFSEPGAGSDVAGLATRAERDGDEWVVNGQKVWTSLAHLARYGMLLARTDPDQPKHKGLSYFVVDMHQPGVDVRPLRQITGDAEFNEVFFENARIPDAWRLGPVGEGWRVAISILMNERSVSSGSGAALPGTAVGRSVVALIRRHAPVIDPVLRQRLAQAYIEDRLVTLTNQRAADRRRAGQPPGPEGSVTKLFFSEHTQRLQNLAVDLEGPAVQAWPEGDRWLRDTAWSLMRVRAKTIAGGTSEVQRNVLGERILGLPKEPDVDRTVPWSEILRS